MVKSPTWQLARVYIYTLPFANLDMILENCLFAGVWGDFVLTSYRILILVDFTTFPAVCFIKQSSPWLNTLINGKILKPRE